MGLAVVAKDFGMSQGETAWISTAISLSSGSFLLLGGRLADLYGRKIMLMSAFTLAAIWSIIAGFARNKYPPDYTHPQARAMLMVGTCFSWLGGCRDWQQQGRCPPLWEF